MTVVTDLVFVVLLCFSAKEALRQCLPEALRNHTFDEALKEDATTSRWLAQLLYNISTDASVGAGAVQGARLSS